MGNCCLPIRLRRTHSAHKSKNITLLLVGLDNAGKTTIAKRLAGEPVDSVVPTIGFSVITLRQKGCRVSIYDLGGGMQIRDIWPRYCADAHGIIFVVDAVDVDRMEECQTVLHKLLKDNHIAGKPILLLANKQDSDDAMDEIDIVERLNLEKIVNEQKCPTLVELCSALHFSKKIDVGIDNGYKWLIRSIIRDYPTLNNRIILDLAKQEEENKVHFIRRLSQMRKGSDAISSHFDESFQRSCFNPFKPIKKVLEDKIQANGIAEPIEKSTKNSTASIPGFIDDRPEKANKIKRRQFLEETVSTHVQPRRNCHSRSSEFFLIENFRSDAELLNDIPNQTFKNFLVRPKSSGARLYGVRPEKRKGPRRKAIIKKNKTGPTPFTDFKATEHNTPNVFTMTHQATDSNGRKSSSEILKESSPSEGGRISEHELSFFKEHGAETKSMPNSRKNSGNRENAAKRRNSSMNCKYSESFSKIEKIPALKVNNRLNTRREILMDVTGLRHREIE